MDDTQSTLLAYTCTFMHSHTCTHIYEHLPTPSPTHKHTDQVIEES